MTATSGTVTQFNAGVEKNFAPSLFANVAGVIHFPSHGKYSASESRVEQQKIATNKAFAMVFGRVGCYYRPQESLPNSEFLSGTHPQTPSEPKTALASASETLDRMPSEQAPVIPFRGK